MTTTIPGASSMPSLARVARNGPHVDRQHFTRSTGACFSPAVSGSIKSR